MDTDQLLEEKNEEIYKLKQKILLTEQVTKDLETEKETLSSQLQAKTDQHLNLKNKLKALHSQHEEELLEQEALTNELNEKKISMLNLKSPNNCDISDKLKHENKEISCQIDDLTIENETLKSKLEDIRKENNEIKLKKDELQRVVTESEMKLNESKSILEKKEKQFASAVELRNELQDETMSLEMKLEEVKSTSTKTAKGNSLFGEVDERCKEMKDKMETIKISREKLKKKCESISKECKEMLKENIKKCKLLNIEEEKHLKHRHELLSQQNTLLDELQQKLPTAEEIDNMSLFKFTTSEDEKLNQWLNEIEEDFKKQLKDYQNKVQVNAVKDYAATRDLYEKQCELLYADIKKFFFETSLRNEILKKSCLD